jgi:hypothetical protein
MGDGFRRAQVQDGDWGVIKLLFPLAQPGDPWGVLAPLRGTVWGDQVPSVSGESLSHALHGWLTPLMREIGVEPLVHARRIPEDLRRCAQHETCPIVGRGCQPGPATPDCYDPPELEGQSLHLARTVALAWAESRYVVVVTGPEFTLR